MSDENTLADAEQVWHLDAMPSGGFLIYSLREDTPRRGPPFMVNDVTIRVERSLGYDKQDGDLKAVADRIFAALGPFPATSTDYGRMERIATQAESYVLVIDGEHINIGAVIRALYTDHRRLHGVAADQEKEVERRLAHAEARAKELEAALFIADEGLNFMHLYRELSANPKAEQIARATIAGKVNK